MTAQLEDVFYHGGFYHALAGISEGELLDMSALGLRPVAVTTHCWRGYQALFAVSGTRLVMVELRINLFDGVEEDDGSHLWMEGMKPTVGPVINNVRPFIPVTKPPESIDELGEIPEYTEVLSDSFNNHYKGLLHPLAYSGGVLLGRNPAPGVDSSMGFCAAWDYETVIELVFDAGILVKESDRSAQMAEIRPLMQARFEALAARFWNAEDSEEPSVDEALTKYISEAFDRSYAGLTFAAGDLEGKS
ncbi:MAG: hypothetical protein GX630_05395 [Actinobacteria bacterium]|nr:hypothetical protein [Actinomycetota bacterium]